MQTEQESAERTVQLALINDIGQKIAAVQELDKSLNTAACLIQESFDHHHVALLLIDGDVMRLGAVAGAYQRHFLPDHTQPLSQGITGWVALHGKKIIAQDVTIEPRYIPLLPQHSVTRAELCLPLKLTDQIVGVLDIQSPHQNAFSETEITALETLSLQLALTIENTRLHETVQKELSERSRSEEASLDSIQQFKIAYQQAKIYAEELKQEIAERKSLAEIWRRYEFIANASKEFMTLIGRDYRYEAVNEAYCRALDKSRSEIIGSAVVDVWGQERYISQIEEHLEKCFAGHEVHYQKWFQFATLGRRYFDVAYYPYFSDRGAVTHAVVVFRDMTERKHAEEVLQEAKELFEKTFTSQRDAIFILDASMPPKILDCNPATTEVFDYAREEMLGRPINLLHVDERAQQNFQEHYYPAITKQGFLYLPEFEMRRRDGSIFPAEYSVVPLQDDQGHSIGLVSVVRDITERIQAQEALKRSEERFRQVIVSISAHIYVTEITADGRQVNLYLSPHAEALTGYPQEKFEEDWNFWPTTVIHPDDRALAATQAAQLAMGLSSEVEYRLVRADGAIVWVRDSARVEDDGNSKIIYGLVSDITERRLAEEEIRKLNEGLEQRVIDRTRELSALYEVTAVGSEALDLKTMLTRTLERILAAMGSSEGHIHLLDQAGTILRLAAQQGVPPDIAIQITSTPLHQGLAGWVVKYGEPLLVPNMAAEIEKLHSSPGRDSHTYAGAPMRSGGQIVGVLCVIREAEQQFSVEEVALLSSIADQVGVMVENSRLRRQAEHAAVMEERERLARELHDSVTQSLYSLTLLAGGGRRMANAGTLTDVADYFTDLGEIAQQALKEMRLLVYELRPAILEREGLVGALQQRLDSVEGRAGVEARLLVEEMIQLPPTVEEDLYRIAQEALNNALKHAAATSVTVRIYADQDQLVMEVIDDGKGFTPEALSDMGGMGLVSIRQRAERLGGRLKVMSAPEDGTTVQVRVTRI